MRAAVLMVALVGCGPVRLGEEIAVATPPDAALVASADSGAKGQLAVVVTVHAAGSCGGCVELTAQANGGRPPYAFTWDDLSTDARRRICHELAGVPLSVRVRDADGISSPANVTRLDAFDAGCPPPVPDPPLLCLQNPSFEGTAAVNSGVPTSFDAPPWSVCTNPSVSNTPEVLNNTIQQMIAKVPEPTDGLTYLGLGEQEQASQELCAAIPPGSERSFELDVALLDINAGLAPDTERGFLEIWGGVAADCVRRELLWASAPLEAGWRTECVTIRPEHFTNHLTLRARADNTLPSFIYLVVDRLVPVSRCP
jgi:hypothetical protein